MQKLTDKLEISQTAVERTGKWCLSYTELPILSGTKLLVFLTVTRWDHRGSHGFIGFPVNDSGDTPIQLQNSFDPCLASIQ